MTLDELERALSGIKAARNDKKALKLLLKKYPAAPTSVSFLHTVYSDYRADLHCPELAQATANFVDQWLTQYECSIRNALREAGLKIEENT